jgi:hypothetical protein
VPPDTRYAWNGDVSLAYQALGDGEPVVLYLQGYLSNVELNWDRGVHELKGVPDRWRLFALVSGRPTA